MNNEGKKYTIELPWFDKCLMPNNRAHRMQKANARKQARADCYMLTKSKLATLDFKPPTGRLAISIMFHEPDRRGRDADGCLSAIKGHLDGVADALGIDDRQFRPITIDFGEVTKGGKIILEICEKS